MRAQCEGLTDDTRKLQEVRQDRERPAQGLCRKHARAADSRGRKPKSLRTRKATIGQARKHCSKKHGYSTKAARDSCMSRRMSGKFAGT